MSGMTIIEMRERKFVCLACGKPGVSTAPNAEYHQSRECLEKKRQNSVARAKKRARAGRSNKMQEIEKQKATRSRLTAREQDLVRLVAKGASNKEIAFALSLSEETVKVYMSKLYAKLGIRSGNPRVQVAVLSEEILNV